MSAQTIFETGKTFFGHPVKKKEGPSFKFVKFLCSETKLGDDCFEILKSNHVHDDNVECINWQDLKDMGIPVAPAK